jgi:hypothetical protein
MRLRPNRSTSNVDIFLDKLFTAYPFRQVQPIRKDLKDIIIKSRCPHITYGDIGHTGGIAKSDGVIISNKMFNTQFNNHLFVILHEISHQYQYSKHGEELAMQIYKQNIPVEMAATVLRHIEDTADRLARQMMNRLFVKYDLPPISRGLSYGHMSDESLIRYITSVREMVKTNKLKTIKQINDKLIELVNTKGMG